MVFGQRYSAIALPPLRRKTNRRTAVTSQAREPFSGGHQALGHCAPNAMSQNSSSRRTIRSQAASTPGESVAWTLQAGPIVSEGGRRPVLNELGDTQRLPAPTRATLLGTPVRERTGP